MNLIAQPLPDHSRRVGPVKWWLAALAAALIPLVAALVLLGSAARGRPLLDRRQEAPGAGKTVTTVWGIGLLVIAILQAAGALFAGMSVTSPSDVLIRTLASLALEGVIFAGIRVYRSAQ